MIHDDLSLPGTIPGLLRLCSPVLVDLKAVGIYCGLDGMGHHVFLWRPCLSDWYDLTRLHLDLTSETGRAHAVWWLRDTGSPLASAFTHGKANPGHLHQLGGHAIEPLIWDGTSWLDDRSTLPDGSPRVQAEILRRVCLYVAEGTT